MHPQPPYSRTSGTLGRKARGFVPASQGTAYVADSHCVGTAGRTQDQGISFN
jgi:hypothetical protein